jgi:hypothetical protein
MRNTALTVGVYAPGVLSLLVQSILPATTRLPSMWPNYSSDYSTFDDQKAQR